MSSPPCPLCGCPTPGGHACSTVPPLPPVPLVVDAGERRAFLGPGGKPVVFVVKRVKRQG